MPSLLGLAQKPTPMHHAMPGRGDPPPTPCPKLQDEGRAVDCGAQRHGGLRQPEAARDVWSYWALSQASRTQFLEAEVVQKHLNKIPFKEVWRPAFGICMGQGMSGFTTPRAIELCGV